MSTAMATKRPPSKAGKEISNRVRPSESEVFLSDAETKADFLDASNSNRFAPKAARKSSSKKDIYDNEIEFSDTNTSEGDYGEEDSVSGNNKKRSSSRNPEGVMSSGWRTLKRADSLDTSKRKLDVDLFEEAKGDFKPRKINRRRSLDMGYCAPKAYTRRSSYNADDVVLDSSIKRVESENSIDGLKKRNKAMREGQSDSEREDSDTAPRRTSRRKSIDLEQPSSRNKDLTKLRRLSSMSNLDDLLDNGAGVRKLKRRSSMDIGGGNEDAKDKIAKMKKRSSLNTDKDTEYDGGKDTCKPLRKSKSCTADGKDPSKPLRKSKSKTDDGRDSHDEQDARKPLRKSKMMAGHGDLDDKYDKKASSSGSRHHRDRKSATDEEEYDKKESSSGSRYHRGRKSDANEEEYDKKALSSGSGHRGGKSSAADEDEFDKKSSSSDSRHHRGRTSASEKAETPIPVSPLIPVEDLNKSDVEKGDESHDTEVTAPASTPGRRGSEADAKLDPKGKGKGEQKKIQTTRSKRRKKRRRRGFCALCLICTVYMFTICLACTLGIWFGMKLLLDDSESALETMKGYLNDFMAGKEPLTMSQTLSDGNSTGTGTIEDENEDELNSGSVHSNFTMENKGVPSSSEPTETRSPSFDPIPSPLRPTSVPSQSPTTPFPTSTPSYAPSTSHSPSSSPTGLPGCPDKLLKSVELGSSALTMYYEIVNHNDALSDKGGLFCVSLEYKGAAGWLGVALSEASRDPAFGRKEAIIGIPGIKNAIAVAKENAELGQQSSPMDGAPYYVNPGKYEIPAGGYDGYSGPSLSAMRPYDYQTLTDAWTNTTTNGDGSEITQLAFTKYLKEPGEINLNPFKSTLFLYAVAQLNGRNEYDSNPQWEYTYLQLIDDTAVSRSFFSQPNSALDTNSDYPRKRLRQPRKSG